jgi:hypothetical protein
MVMMANQVLQVRMVKMVSHLYSRLKAVSGMYLTKMVLKVVGQNLDKLLAIRVIPVHKAQKVLKVLRVIQVLMVRTVMHSLRM